MSPLDSFAYSALITSVTTFFLGGFVYLSRRRSEINQSFSLYSIAIAFWSYCVYRHGIAATLYDAKFWGHALHIGSISIPLLFYRFILVYLGYYRTNFHRRIFYCGCVLWLFFQCINYTDLFVPGVRLAPPLKYLVIAGPLYHLFVAYFAAFILYSIYLIYRSLRISSGPLQIQLRFFLISTILGYIGGIDNFLIMYDIKIFPLFPYGTYTIAIYVAVATFLIFRYRFLDIEVIIKKTLVFTGLFGVLMVVIGLVTVFTQSYVGQFFGMGRMTGQILTVLIAMLLFDPTRKILISLTDQFLFQKKYDYHKLLKDASRGMSNIQSLNRLVGLVLHFVTMKMRVKNAAVLMRSPDGTEFNLLGRRGYDEQFPSPSLNEKDPLIDYLTRHKEAIDIERIKERIEASVSWKKKSGEKPVYDYEAIQDQMISLRASCCVPSFLGKELKDVLTLGEKKSGEYYSTEDLNLLYTLAQESAIAIENARLYDEAVQRSRELTAMNKELNDANAKLKVTQASLIVAEKNATMVGMAKAIGHEVNNPLATVAGRATWIYRDEVLKCKEIVARNASLIPGEDVRGLEKRFFNIGDNALRIEKSAKRIEVVVKTLTDILKDTKGEKGPLSLLVLCQEAREATRFLTYEENLSGCQIIANIESNIVILGNLEQLLQVFINMIKNAYEAMIGQQERQIEIKGNIDRDDPKMARIEFIDNGPGIPAEILPKIWAQGFSTKMKKENHIGAAGQGQGLFVCKHVIESIHNGELFVESAPGKGTTFVIKLPLADMEG